MKITFYSIAACPRCASARKHLKELAADFPKIELTFINALLNPISTYKKGIRMVPALTGKDKLSGVFLSKNQIHDFLIKENEAQNRSIS